MKLSLSLCALSNYKGRADGTPMTKAIFISEAGKVYTTSIPSEQVTPQLEQLVTGIDTYDPERARPWNVQMDSFGDKITYKVDLSAFRSSSTKEEPDEPNF